MIIRPKKMLFGKRYPINPHKGKLIETVILKFPDLIYWMAEKNAPHGSEWLPGYVEKCIDLFDAKPFTQTCEGKVDGVACTNKATRFSLYRGSTLVMFWCATCDPGQMGAPNLTTLDRYYDALHHIWRSTSRNRQFYRSVIHRIAEAKGFTGSFTEKKVVQFFYGPDAKPVGPLEEDEEDGE